MADAEKALGNDQFKVGNYDQAIVHFSKAIELGATHVLYSNRSACYCGLKQWDQALSDVRISPAARPLPMHPLPKRGARHARPAGSTHMRLWATSHHQHAALSACARTHTPT
jgi:stress-induced-phosphoprotein 1